MLNIEAITRQVSENCSVSDAHSAGLYSICGLALRLRDLFKWEMGLPPWEEREPAELLEWIGQKEALWDRIENRSLSKLKVDGKRYDPFDTAGVNRVLLSEGLYYGAGYAQSLKPTFFLAHIEEKTEVEGVEVYTLGKELARDLLTLPALSQNGQVLLRSEAARLFLWDQIFYIKKSGRAALGYALRACGLPDPKTETIKGRLDDLFQEVRNLYVYHEIGEVKNRTFDRSLWQEIVASFAHTPVELLARTLKDLLADTDPNGTLPRLIRERRSAAVGFYAAFFDGLARVIFPDLRPGFARFADDGDFDALNRIVSRANRDLQDMTARFLAIFSEGQRRGDPEWTRREVERTLIGPINRERSADR